MPKIQRAFTTTFVGNVRGPGPLEGLVLPFEENPSESLLAGDELEFEERHRFLGLTVTVVVGFEGGVMMISPWIERTERIRVRDCIRGF